MHEITSYSAHDTLVGDFAIRTQLREDGVWFVAKDIASALGYKWKGYGTIKHIPEPWRTTDQIPTGQGLQEMVLLSEQGLYFFLNRSDKPAALPFQMWVNGTVLPELRKKVAPLSIEQPIVMSQLQVLQSTINFLVKQELRLDELSSKQDQMRSEMDALIDTRTKALKSLSEIPEPTEEVSDVSIRATLSRVVREFGKATGAENYADLWNKLYLEFRDRYHVDLKVIAENRGVGPLDIAEERDLMGKLYALAHHLFRRRTTLPTGSLTWIK